MTAVGNGELRSAECGVRGLLQHDRRIMMGVSLRLSIRVSWHLYLRILAPLFTYRCTSIYVSLHLYLRISRFSSIHYSAAGSPLAALQANHSKLVPPRALPRPKVVLQPGRQEHRSISRRGNVRQGERQGSRSTHHRAVGIVLGAVTGTNELAVVGRPRNDAAQVRADGIQGKGLDGCVVVLDKEVAVTMMVRPRTTSIDRHGPTHVASPFSPCTSERSPAGLESR